MSRRLETQVPGSEEELLARAWSLAGLRLGELAARLEREVPPDLRRAKGWVGRLLEDLLGATASSRPHPDFEALGIELKSVPVDRRGRPRESTFVCSVPLSEIGSVSWAASRVRQKLDRVLWLPVEADPGIPLAERHLGSPLLWSPDREEDRWLEEDWEEVAELIAGGYVEAVSAHRGRCLQVRPKGASARDRRWGVDGEGVRAQVPARGFYLRAGFTSQILGRHFVMPA